MLFSAPPPLVAFDTIATFSGEFGIEIFIEQILLHHN
jgi:hypothetical protein